jgi:hypothetical protein
MHLCMYVCVYVCMRVCIYSLAQLTFQPRLSTLRLVSWTVQNERV